MLDTVVLCGNTEINTHSQPKFDSKEDELLSYQYLKSIEEKIKSIADTVPYILVAGHFPVWSVAEHGPTQCLVEKLRPILHQNKVSAYFCGHDHNLQVSFFDQQA